jgi:hypothetical protein
MIAIDDDELSHFIVFIYISAAAASLLSVASWLHFDFRQSTFESY